MCRRTAAKSKFSGYQNAVKKNWTPLCSNMRGKFIFLSKFMEILRSPISQFICILEFRLGAEIYMCVCAYVNTL